ncbi:MAG: hypothetical protein P4N60_08610, partial [Verrucomicrobiae bacterium]|nr:hypothetical protein [Verrucomicrobiae bacterium]
TFFISTSLAGWSVGLKPSPCGRLEVWFGRLLLGWIEVATASFQRADMGMSGPATARGQPTSHHQSRNRQLDQIFCFHSEGG